MLKHKFMKEQEDFLRDIEVSSQIKNKTKKKLFVCFIIVPTITLKFPPTSPTKQHNPANPLFRGHPSKKPFYLFKMDEVFIVTSISPRKKFRNSSDGKNNLKNSLKIFL